MASNSEIYSVIAFHNIFGSALFCFVRDYYASIALAPSIRETDFCLSIIYLFAHLTSPVLFRAIDQGMLAHSLVYCDQTSSSDIFSHWRIYF